MNKSAKESLDSSKDDFETPVVFKKFKKVRTTEAATAKRCKIKKPSRKKQMTLHDVINQNFSHTDVNSDHLQLALALSKSILEEKNAEEEIDIGPLTQQKGSPKRTLLEYGFQSNRTKLSVENRALKKEFQVSKNKKSKFRFMTPILISRTEEERKSLIESKLSLIIHQNILEDTSEKRNNLSFCSISEEITEMLCEECCLFRRDSRVHGNSAFRVSSLNFIESKSKCGSLLKDWKTIALRDHSPERTSDEIINNKNQLYKTLETDVSPQKGSYENIENYEDVVVINEQDEKKVELYSETATNDSDFSTPARVNYLQDESLKKVQNRDTSLHKMNKIPLDVALSPDLFDEDIQYKCESSKSSPESKKNLNHLFFEEKLNSATISKDNIMDFDISGKNFEDYFPTSTREYGSYEENSEKVTCHVVSKENDSAKPNVSGLELKLNESKGEKTRKRIVDFPEVIESFEETIILSSSEDDHSDESESVKTSCGQISSSTTLSKHPKNVTDLEDEFQLSSNYFPLVEKKVFSPLKEPFSVSKNITNKELQIKSIYFANKEIPGKEDDSLNNLKSYEVNDKNVLLETSSEMTKLIVDENLHGVNDSNNSGCISRENISLNLTEHIEKFLRYSYGQVKTLTLSEEEFEETTANGGQVRTSENMDSTVKLDNFLSEAMSDDENEILRIKDGEDVSSGKDTTHSLSDVICISDEEINYSSTGRMLMENETCDDEKPNNTMKFENVPDLRSETFQNVLVTPSKKTHFGRNKSESNLTPIMACKTSEISSNLKFKKSASFCDDPNSKFNRSKRNNCESSSTPPREVIIKTENVTPMINYDTLATPDIVRELDKFGLKPMKRKRGVNLLKHIYEATHPLVALKRNNESEKKRISTKKFKENSPKLERENFPELEHDEMIDQLVGSISESMAIFERQRSSKVPTCPIPLQLAWHNFLLCNPQIQENILLYEPLQVEIIHKTLKDLGFKFHLQDLITFFDQKCITIRVAQNHTNLNKT